ncbi:hypothetical protein [Amycolatopsis anabasis]|uniref:hypothetical protein n=1 Tax=Amycolatopsis anabasis TaxID=1840409 RepID=UPI00131D252C|nr:hypothetical protein [Amycolatopsis anabasis]
MGWTELVNRLFGDRLPEGFPGSLDPEESALASAPVSGGGHLVVTALGLWVPAGEGARRIGWHLISKAAWRDETLTVTEAEETGDAGAFVVLADRDPVRFTVTRPGKVPLMVRQRVDGSIRSRHREEFASGGAWFVQRKVPGRDGTVLQVRPDPGTDPDVVAAIAREAAAKLANPPS